MPIKLKPSTKEYKRDTRGKIINDKLYTWRHYPPCSFKTEELKEMFSNSIYRIGFEEFLFLVYLYPINLNNLISKKVHKKSS